MQSIHKGKLKFYAAKIPFLLMLGLMLMLPTATMEGAVSGLLLWFNTILPVLLPFIIISGLVVRLNLIHPVTKLLYPILKVLLPVSKNGCYPVFIGFLSGLPMGAKTVADLLEQGKLDKQEARYLLPLCNNASPMFLLNYAATVQLGQPKFGPILCFILYASTILSSFIACHPDATKKIENPSEQILPKKTAIEAASLSDEQNTKQRVTQKSTLISQIDQAIMSGFEVITKVGGYVMLFSILAAYLALLPVPSIITALLSSVLEMTTGIHQISLIHADAAPKFLLTAVAAAFGGLSGLAQTQSVISTTGLSMRCYIKAKLINALIAGLISLLVLFIFM